MIRAKFKCESIAENEDSFIVKLSAVVDGSVENKEFFKWTPSGQLTLGCVNPAVREQLEVGKEYYLDISPAKESSNE